VIGAVTLVPLSAWLDAELGDVLPGIQGVVYGIANIAVIMLAPEGVFWRVRDLVQRRAKPEGLGPPESAAVLTPETEAAQRFQARQTQSASDELSPASPLLAVRNLSKSFGGLRAVAEISFEIRHGEILGIIGPNGAGKTTLFNLLNGFASADSGIIEFDGARIDGQRPNRICLRGVGRTFQVVKPFRRLAIADNVIVGAYLRADSIDDARERTRDALAIVGLSQQANTLAAGAGNRELRLMEIARALATQPSVLLLDEVFAGLTAEEVAEISALLRRITELGVTIAIIEHTMQAMVRLVDRFIVLDHGQVLATGTPDQVTQNPAVIEAYLGKKWLTDA
jgi:branched-chain amino acid transport system permease protein